MGPKAKVPKGSYSAGTQGPTSSVNTECMFSIQGLPSFSASFVKHFLAGFKKKKKNENVKSNQVVLQINVKSTSSLNCPRGSPQALISEDEATAQEIHTVHIVCCLLTL